MVKNKTPLLIQKVLKPQVVAVRVLWDHMMPYLCSLP